MKLLRATAFAISQRQLRMQDMGSDQEQKTLGCCFRDVGISQSHMIIHKWVRDTIRTKWILTKQVALREFLYIGHIIRREGFDKEILLGLAEGKRLQRRPRFRLRILRGGIE